VGEQPRCSSSLHASATTLLWTRVPANNRSHCLARQWSESNSAGHMAVAGTALLVIVPPRALRWMLQLKTPTLHAPTLHPQILGAGCSHHTSMVKHAPRVTVPQLPGATPSDAELHNGATTSIHKVVPQLVHPVRLLIETQDCHWLTAVVRRHMPPLHDGS